VAELDLKLSKAQMYPEIGFVSSYNYARSESEIGFLQSNLTTGLTYGLTARINIFDGMNNRTRNQMAQITIEQNKHALDQTALQLENDLYNAFAAYEMARKLNTLERENVKVAQQTLDIAKEQMRLGSITAIELRQAQVNLVDAEFRQIQTAYELKLAETELIRLSGELIGRN
ncbi:MAG: TolC family protein, partial [Flavobacteriales bacterium]|nr:TolC family protein [Flavobacteriales bacterium]